MRNAMKYLLIFLSCLSIYSYAQPKLGMSPIYTVTPTSAINATVGVAPNTNFYIQGWVKNKGNVIFSGDIKVLLALDTIPGPPVPLDTATYINVLLAPGDSLAVADSASTSPAQGFKSGGNGNTIVVWPISTSAQTIDSLRTVVYVSPFAGIEELGIQPLDVYPNPAGSRLYIKAPENVALKTIAVHDIYMRKVMECDYTGLVDLSPLRAGTYWIRAVANNRAYAVLIIKME